MLCADKNGYTGREIKIYELDDEWIYLIFPSEEITKECPRISINREWRNHTWYYKYSEA